MESVNAFALIVVSAVAVSSALLVASAEP